MDLMELSCVEREIRKEFPSFRIIPKAESRFMQVIDILLRILSFGQLRHFRYFTTTIGTTVYVPASWTAFEPVTRAVLLRHEAVHMRQIRRHGRLLFSLMYLFLPLPIGLAWYRTQFEREAYEESLRAYHEYGIDITTSRMRGLILDHFLGADYLWMWPFKGSMNAWYSETVTKVLSTVKKKEV